eukprot:CAMPEP_0116909584 /NCGR_PEP_ID=MMETSP0467-20121206/14361_1 /TAXON_ID=283647 /ORGANISM="Mesodinium pulex, Strain SPMC105" /LENGTH=76 /DNA_ID=CAMNT_0004584967 /DNA_START=617 /DNA_END=847 /DNA_ORIENTATION=-
MEDEDRIAAIQEAQSALNEEDLRTYTALKDNLQGRSDLSESRKQAKLSELDLYMAVGFETHKRNWNRYMRKIVDSE